MTAFESILAPQRAWDMVTGAAQGIEHERWGKLRDTCFLQKVYTARRTFGSIWMPTGYLTICLAGRAVLLAPDIGLYNCEQVE